MNSLAFLLNMIPGSDTFQATIGKYLVVREGLVVISSDIVSDDDVNAINEVAPIPDSWNALGGDPSNKFV